MAVVVVLVVVPVLVVLLMVGGQVPGGHMQLSSSTTRSVGSSPGEALATGWHPNTMTLSMLVAFLVNV